MRMSNPAIIHAINTSPLNRGLRGEDWVANPRNIAVTADEDIALFDFEAPGFYQVHILYGSRGVRALNRIREAFRQMFTEHAADGIFAMVPDFRRDVKMMARWTGMEFAGKRDTDCGMCELFFLTRTMWKRSLQ